VGKAIPCGSLLIALLVVLRRVLNLVDASSADDHAAEVRRTATTKEDDMIRINERLLSWASILEDQAREQAIATSRLPFVAPHVALMPDAHWGMGSTVGSVIPTVGVVMPAAVGVDIGCGMAAVRTQLTRTDVDARGDLARLRVAIQDRVPVSPGVYRPELTDTARTRVEALEAAAARQDVQPDRYSGRSRAADWRLQLGTLGGGNHFIELCYDEADRVWVFLHSGSRGVGNRIAKHHVAVAQELCERWHVQLPHRDLAFLPEGDPAFQPYIRDLRWAQAFALENRAEMLDQVVAALAAWIEGPITAEEKILCHHNYTERVDANFMSIDNPGSDSPLIGHQEAAGASTAPGSPDGHRLEHRSHGELVRLAEGIVQGLVPSPVDALVRNQLRSLRDGLAQEPARSRSRRRSVHPCSCQSGHRSDCVADAARKLVSTLQETHPSAAEDLARTWDRPQDEAFARAFGRPARETGSLPSRQSNGKEVWLTRKGAINAEAGRWGLIPGSMGTRSYVVTGKGNRASFNSAPHGAGRNFSRTEARRRFTAADLTEAMRGIEWRSDKAEAFVDEIPGAYKDVDVVMRDAADLVRIEHTLRQFLNVKGD
jgi:RNA-splicing ligase RtcB